MLAIAIGVVWLGLASDRRATAVGRFVLGAGLIAFGLHVLRPAFEPFVGDGTLIPFVDHLRTDSVRGLVTCALLGAALVAAFQGPAPVVVLVLGIAQTTGHLDLRTALAILTGSGLGAAVGALLTTPRARARAGWSQLHLLLGAASTVLALATVRIWSALADRLVAGSPHEIEWGKRVLLPNMGSTSAWRWPCRSSRSRWCWCRWFPGWRGRWRALRRRRRRRRSGTSAITAGSTRRGSSSALPARSARRSGVAGSGAARPACFGPVAEHALADARATLEEVLSIAAAEGATDRRGAGRLSPSFSSNGAREPAATSRTPDGSAGRAARPAPARCRRLLEQEEDGRRPDARAARSADWTDQRRRLDRQDGDRCRRGARTGDRDERPGGAGEGRAAGAGSPRAGALLANEMGVLELVDAYEIAGNQLYRAAEALGADDGEPAGL